MSFLMVSHTHEDVDQVRGNFSNHKQGILAPFNIHVCIQYKQQLTESTIFKSSFFLRMVSDLLRLSCIVNQSSFFKELTSLRTSIQRNNFLVERNKSYCYTVLKQPDFLYQSYCIAVFSRIAVKLRSRNVMTVPELQATTTESYTTSPETHDLEWIFDISGWLDENIIKLKNHIYPHSFKFFHAGDGEARMVYKNWAQDKTWKPDDTPIIILPNVPVGTPTLI